MTAYPPSAPVNVRLDGQPIGAYNGAFARGGRVVGPLLPFVTAVSDRIRIEGRLIVIERGGRRAYVRLPKPQAPALDRVYVPLAPVLRDLGLRVGYARHTLDITVPPGFVLATPSPYPPGAPLPVPRAVFTPMVTPTPRPVWTGSPLPRRTPLPFVEPTPARPRR